MLSMHEELSDKLPTNGCYHYDHLNQTLYLLQNGQVFSHDLKHKTNTAMTIPCHIGPNKPTHKLPKLQTVSGSLFLNTQSNLACNSISNESVLRGSLSICQGMVWEFHAPESLQGLSFGVCDEKNKESVMVQFISSTSRTVKVQVQANSIRFWVNNSVPSRNHTKEVQYNQENLKMYPCVKLKQKAKTVIYNPFAQLPNTQTVNPFCSKSCPLPHKKQQQVNQKHLEPHKIKIIKQLNHNRMLLIWQNDYAKVVSRNPSDNRFHLPSTTVQNQYIYGLFNKQQYQQLSKFASLHKCQLFCFQQCYRIEFIYEWIGYLLQTLDMTGIRQRPQYCKLVQKLLIIRPYLSDNKIPNPVTHSQFDATYYPFLSKYFTIPKHPYQVAATTLLNELPCCLVTGEILAYSQNYMCSHQQGTYHIYTLTDAVREVFVGQLQYHQFSKSKLLETFSKEDLINVKSNEESHIYKILMGCILKETSLSIKHQVNDRHLQQLIKDYKINHKSAYTALELNGTVDQALVWLATKQQNQHSMQEESIKEKVIKEDKLQVSLLQVDLPFSRLLLQMGNSIYLFGLNPRQLNKFVQKLKKQCINLSTFKHEYDFKDLNTQSWWNYFNHQSLSIQDRLITQSRPVMLARIGSTINLIRIEQGQLLRNTMDVYQENVFEPTSCLKLQQEYTPLNNGIKNLKDMIRTIHGQLFYSEADKQVLQGQTVLIFGSKLLHNANGQLNSHLSWAMDVDVDRQQPQIRILNNKSQYIPMLVQSGPPGCNLNYPICSIMVPDSAFLANYPHPIRLTHLHSKYIQVHSIIIQRLHKRKNVNQIKQGYIYFNNDNQVCSKHYNFQFDNDAKQIQVTIHENKYWKYMNIVPKYNCNKRMPYEMGHIRVKGICIQSENMHNQLIRTIQSTVNLKDSEGIIPYKIDSIKECDGKILKCTATLSRSICSPKQMNLQTKEDSCFKPFGLDSYMVLKKKSNVYSDSNIDFLDCDIFKKLFEQNQYSRSLILSELALSNIFSFKQLSNQNIRMYVQQILGYNSSLKTSVFNMLMDKIMHECEMGRRYVMQISDGLGLGSFIIKPNYMGYMLAQMSGQQHQKVIKDVLGSLNKVRNPQYEQVRKCKIPYLVLQKHIYSQYYLDQIDGSASQSQITEIYEGNVISTELVVLKEELSRKIIVKMDSLHLITNLVLRFDRSQLNSQLIIDIYAVSKTKKQAIYQSQIQQYQWLQVTKYPHKSQIIQLFHKQSTTLNALGIIIDSVETQYLQIQLIYTDTGIISNSTEESNIPFIDILPQVYGHKVGKTQPYPQFEEYFQIKEEDMFYLSKVNIGVQSMHKYTVSQGNKFEYNFYRQSKDTNVDLIKNITENVNKSNYIGLIPFHKQLVKSKQFSKEIGLDYLYTVMTMTLGQIEKANYKLQSRTCEELLQKIIKKEVGPIRTAAFKVLSHNIPTLIHSLPYLDGYIPNLQQVDFTTEDLMKLLDTKNQQLCECLSNLILQSIPYSAQWANLVVKLAPIVRKDNQLLNYLAKHSDWCQNQTILQYVSQLPSKLFLNTFVKALEPASLFTFIVACKNKQIQVPMQSLIQTLIGWGQPLNRKVVHLILQNNIQWNSLSRVIQLCPESEQQIITKYLNGCCDLTTLAVNHPDLLQRAALSKQHVMQFGVFMLKLYRGSISRFKIAMLALPEKYASSNSSTLQIISGFLHEECMFGGIQGAKLLNQAELTSIMIALKLLNNINNIQQGAQMSAEQQQKLVRWYLCNNTYETNLTNPVAKSTGVHLMRQLCQKVSQLLCRVHVDSVLTIFNSLKQQLQNKVNVLLSYKHIFMNQLHKAVYDLLQKSITPQALTTIIIGGNDMLTQIIREIQDHNAKNKINSNSDPVKVKSKDYTQNLKAFIKEEQPVKDWQAGRTGVKSILFKVPITHNKITLVSQQNITVANLVVGFNIAQNSQRNNILPAAVTLYGGDSPQNLVKISELKIIEDQHYTSFGVTTFATNLYSLNNLNSNVSVKILQLRMRAPLLPSVSDILQNLQKNKKNGFYGLSFLSVNGYEVQPEEQPDYGQLYFTLLEFLSQDKYTSTLDKVIEQPAFKSKFPTLMQCLCQGLPNQKIAKLIMALNKKGLNVLKTVLKAPRPDRDLLTDLLLSNISIPNINLTLDYALKNLNAKVIDILTKSLRIANYSASQQKDNPKIRVSIQQMLQKYQKAPPKQKKLLLILLSTLLSCPNIMEIDFIKLMDTLWSTKNRADFYPLISSMMCYYQLGLDHFMKAGYLKELIDECISKMGQNGVMINDDPYQEICLLSSVSTYGPIKKHLIEWKTPLKLLGLLQNECTLLVKYNSATIEQFICLFRATCIQSECADEFSLQIINMMNQLPKINTVHHHFFIHEFFFPIINSFNGIPVIFVWTNHRNQYITKITQVLHDKPIKSSDKVVQYDNKYYHKIVVDSWDNLRKDIIIRNQSQQKIVAILKQQKPYEVQTNNTLKPTSITISDDKKMMIKLAQQEVHINHTEYAMYQQSEYDQSLLTNQTLLKVDKPLVFTKQYTCSLPIQNSTYEEVYLMPLQMSLKEMLGQFNLLGLKLTNNTINNLQITDYYNHKKLELNTKIRDVAASQQIPLIKLQISAVEIFSDITIEYIVNTADKQMPAFVAQETIFKSFEKQKGLQKMIKVLKSCVKNWKNQQQNKIWMQYLNELESYSCFPVFSSIYMNKQENVSLLFDLLAGLPDRQDCKKWNKLQKKSVRFLYDIIKDVFQVQGKQALSIRKYALESDFYKTMLQRLHLVTKETKRYKVQEESQQQEIDLPDIQKKSSQEQYKQKVKKKKGVGYGTDNSSNQKWDVTGQEEARKEQSEQVRGLLSILEKFLDHPEFQPPKELVDQSFESALLPILESTLRGGSLLQISKFADLILAELSFIRALSRKLILIPTLMQIPKTYEPSQPQSLLSILKVLEGTSKIFLSCLTGSVSEKTSQQIAKQIIETYRIVDEAISEYKMDEDEQQKQKKILEMPLIKKYYLLMKDLRFDYVDMKDKSNKITSHQYSSSFLANHKSPAQKTIRLAQELADISHALPISHTNSIYVRCDKERVDFMQALIMGSNGTPYGHGAYLFDIYFDDTYPSNPPKVNLTTTGSGSIRFNPNLYACGKVCLSLLGTWRGNAMENWDAKVSTLLQVLVSIQSIIMSEEVYFNQPGFEHEQGTLEGEKKNQAYANIVRYGNIKFAMIENIKKPPKGFQSVIRRHFYLKKEEILEQCKKWLKYAEKRQASYNGLVSDHNNNWCNTFKKNKNQYKKMLEKAINQLQAELNKLPEPTSKDLKADISPKKEMKAKKVKMQYQDANLDEVDVTYDKAQQTNYEELDINDDKVKDRWSRYIGAMGVQAVAKQSKARIFMFGIGPVGIEIAKNIILSGCKQFTIHDKQLVKWQDLSGQFFISEEDVGKSRIESCLYKLQQLNHYVHIDSVDVTESLAELKGYHIIICTQQSVKDQLKINAFCRQNGIKFIIADCYGPCGLVFNDFGSQFEVIDKNGEETVEVMIENITNEQEGRVQLLKGQRHPYEDGEAVRVSNVKGMITQNDDSINGKIYKIKVVNQYEFLIGDTTKYSPYLGNGLARNMKIPIKIQFKDLKQSNKMVNVDANLEYYDFSKASYNKIIHGCFQALSEFRLQYNRLPRGWDESDSQIMIDLVKKGKQSLTDDEDRYVRKFSFTCSGNFPPLAAFYGGLAAQEVFKAITSKYMPINQYFMTDFMEVLPQLPTDTKQWQQFLPKMHHQPNKNRMDALTTILGQQLITKLQSCRVFLIGSGAIGCQLLKNYAMLNLSTGQTTQYSKGGCIVVTDPDHIETSNLNRQFLFRQKHLRKAKSVTAAAAVTQMNPLLKGKVRAKLDKVCQSTKDIFSNEFFQSLTIVTNALDNVQARQYVDLRCVENKVPLLESGTLSSKGHVQVIIPYKTETYGSKADPAEEGEIPHCTLKMFPEQTLHCVQWGRDIFGRTFTMKPKALGKLLQSWQKYKPIPSDCEMLKDCLKMLQKKPLNFDDAVLTACRKFYQYFRNDIKQLLYTYPLDAKTKDGKPFWKLPKRPPTSIEEIQPQNELHSKFITSYAMLLCKIYNIPYPNDIRTQKRRIQVTTQASKIKVQPFIPSDKVAKQMQSEVQNQKQQANKQQQSKTQQQSKVQEKEQQSSEVELFEKLKTIVQDLKKNDEQIKITAQEFEKDEDQNGHIDLIYSMANLRAANYKLDPMDWITTKLKAGKITPALSTTTSCIAALQTIQLVKYIKGCSLEQMKNTFLNLAVPIIQFGEPGEVQKIKIHENLTTNIWERWEIGPFNLDDVTVRVLIQEIQNKYKIIVKTIDIVDGGQIFSDLVLGLDIKKAEKEKLMGKSLSAVISEYISLEDIKNYVDFTVIFAVGDELAKHVPTIRLKLNK